MGLCTLSGEDISSYMGFIIMVVALSHNIVRVALFFSISEENPQERMLLFGDGGSGQLEEEMAEFGTPGLGKARKAHPRSSCPLSVSAFAEVLGWGKEGAQCDLPAPSQSH